MKNKFLLLISPLTYETSFFSHSMKLLLLFKVSSSIWKLCCMLCRVCLILTQILLFFFFYFWIAVVISIQILNNKKESKTFYVKKFVFDLKKKRKNFFCVELFRFLNWNSQCAFCFMFFFSTSNLWMYSEIP